MRFILLLCIALVLAACISTNKEKPINELVVQNGDYISVDYIAKLENGEVFDTTIKEIGENASIPKVEWYNRSSYGSLNFTIGFKRYIFEDYLLGMKIGEKKTIVIPPEKAYGNRSKELVVVTPRFTIFPKVMGFPIYEFIRGTKTVPEVNKTVELKYWKVKVLRIDEENESVVVEHLVENNSIIPIPLGSLKIRLNNSYVIAELEPIVNRTIKINNGFAKVTDVNETHITIDYNHPLAGKKLIYEIIIRDIKRGWPSG